MKYSTSIIHIIYYREKKWTGDRKSETAQQPNIHLSTTFNNSCDWQTKQDK